METSAVLAVSRRPSTFKRPRFAAWALAAMGVLAVVSCSGQSDSHGYNNLKKAEEPKSSPPKVCKGPTRLQKIGAISLGTLAAIKVASALLNKEASSGPVGSLPGQTFVGSGIRSKGPISVYNVKMFIGNRAKSALKAFEGKTLKGNKEFLDVFNKAGFQKTVQIEMLRSVAPSKMVSSFHDAVSTRVARKTFDKISESLDSLLQKSFTPEASKKGSQITFSMTGGASFSISVEGKPKGSIWSPALCEAFTDIYVGPNAVSSGARDSILSGVKTMIA